MPPSDRRTAWNDHRRLRTGCAKSYPAFRVGYERIPGRSCVLVRHEAPDGAGSSYRARHSHPAVDNVLRRASCLEVAAIACVSSATRSIVVSVDLPVSADCLHSRNVEVQAAVREVVMLYPTEREYLVCKVADDFERCSIGPAAVPRGDRPTGFMQSIEERLEPVP